MPRRAATSPGNAKQRRRAGHDFPGTRLASGKQDGKPSPVSYRRATHRTPAGDQSLHYRRRAQTSTSSTVAQRESPGPLLPSCRPSGHWHSVALRGSPAVASDHSQCLSRAYCDANSGCHFSRRRFDDELSLTVRVTYSCHILLELSHPSCHIYFLFLCRCSASHALTSQLLPQRPPPHGATHLPPRLTCAPVASKSSVATAVNATAKGLDVKLLAQ